MTTDLSEQFRLPVDLSVAKRKAAEAAGTICEATMLGVLSDTELERDGKKRRIDKEMASVKTLSNSLGVPIREKMHPLVLSQSVSLLTS